MLSGTSGLFSAPSAGLGGTVGSGVVSVDVRGQVVRMSREQAERLRVRAAAEAGRSGRARDLALVLDWAIGSPHPVVLRRGEAAEFLRFAREDEALAPVVSGIAA